MTSASDNVTVSISTNMTLFRSTYEDYVVVGQNDNMEKPIVHVSADALLLGRALNMIKLKYLQALELLSADEVQYVKDELAKDRLEA